MLLASSGVGEIDALLAEIIGTLDAAFGARVRGYYLVGSYAMACPVWTSDVDVVALFDDAATADEQRRFGDLIAPIRARSRWPIDVNPIDEAELRRDGASRFKFTSTLLYGEDVRDTLPLRPIEKYIRSEIGGAFMMLTRVHGTPGKWLFG